MCTFHPGQCVVIHEADDNEPESLRRWQALGLEPGATVHILSYQPRADLFQLQIGRMQFSLQGEELAAFRGDVVETNQYCRRQNARCH